MNFVVLALFVSTVFAAPLILPQGQLIPGSYIVVFNNTDPLSFRTSHLFKTQIKPVQMYEIGKEFVGYAAKLDNATLARVLADPNVAFVEQDQVLHAFDLQPNAPWHLARIDVRDIADMDGNYEYRSTAGAGATVYVIDTGCRCTHVEFATGRCTFGYDSTGEGLFDGNGHGTHVASLSAGVTYGVAKKATIVAVKVLTSGGSGTTAGVVAGINWSVSDWTGKGKKTSVGNMSLGGPKSAALDTATAAAANAGLGMVVAAGNSNADACQTSPANVPAAITVGATEIDALSDIETDKRSSYSNFGTCVDIFAPGTQITGAWRTSDTATLTISGTSMASPIVAGVVALVLGENPSVNPAQMQTLIKNEGTAGIVNLACGTSAVCRASPNIFLYSQSAAH